MGQKKRFTGASQIAKTNGLLSASDPLSKGRNLAPVWVRYSRRIHGEVAFSSPSHLAVIDSTCDERLKYTPLRADVYETSWPSPDPAERASSLFIRVPGDALCRREDM